MAGRPDSTLRPRGPLSQRLRREEHKKERDECEKRKGWFERHHTLHVTQRTYKKDTASMVAVPSHKRGKSPVDTRPVLMVRHEARFESRKRLALGCVGALKGRVAVTEGILRTLVRRGVCNAGAGTIESESSSVRLRPTLFRHFHGSR